MAIAAQEIRTQRINADYEHVAYPEGEVVDVRLPCIPAARGGHPSADHQANQQGHLSAAREPPTCTRSPVTRVVVARF